MTIMKHEPRRLIDVLANPSALWKVLREYFNLDRWQRLTPINDLPALQEFISTRASYVAQVSLYGYLRTRAGMRYPELFDDDAFVHSINIAKWQIWLACLSDLAIYTGGLLMQHPQADSKMVSACMQDTVNAILNETNLPADAGSEFIPYAQQIRQRLMNCNWTEVTDDETPFSESPLALVQWAPIVEDLKQLDEEIVRNSVRFRWQKVRRELRHSLNTEAILGIQR